MPMEKRVEKRQVIQNPGLLSIEADLIDGKALNLSDHGAKVCVRGPIQIVLRMQVGAYETERRAKLVWARPNPDGETMCGLEFESEAEMVPLGLGGPMHLLW